MSPALAEAIDNFMPHAERALRWQTGEVLTTSEVADFANAYWHLKTALVAIKANSAAPEHSLRVAVSAAIAQLSASNPELEQSDPKRFHGQIAEALFLLRAALTHPREGSEHQMGVAAE